MQDALEGMPGQGTPRDMGMERFGSSFHLPPGFEQLIGLTPPEIGRLKIDPFTDRATTRNYINELHENPPKTPEEYAARVAQMTMDLLRKAGWRTPTPTETSSTGSPDIPTPSQQ